MRSGDSHTDNGFHPQGAQPNRFNPIGNPDFPGRTANYGHNYLSHLTATFNKSFVKTYSLAKEDSVIVRRDFHDWEVPTLKQQVADVFLESYGRDQTQSGQAQAEGAGWMPNETLFVFFAGTDQLVHEFVSRQSGRDATPPARMIDEYRKSLHQVRSIHRRGHAHR